MKKLMETYLDTLLMLQALYTAAIFRLPRDPKHEEELKEKIKAEKAKIITRWVPKDQA